MKYTISESQYKKIILNYLNNMVGDFVVEGYSSWSMVNTINGDEFGFIWHSNSYTITDGCNNELSLDESFINEINQTIPIVSRKIFSKIMLEYFNSKWGRKCDCIEFANLSGEYDKNGLPIDLPAYRYDIKKQ